MRKGVITFQAGRLTQARLARGIKKNELAEKIGVTPTSITNYESGSHKPEPSTFERMCLVLKFPREFFSKPVTENLVDKVFWRTRADTKTAIEMTEQRMIFSAELFEFFSEEMEFPKIELPHFDIPSDASLILNDHIEQVAETLRHSWGYRDDPIPDMVLLAENAGIPVSCLQIPSDKQDGYCFSSKPLNRHFIGLNMNRISSVRVRFDVAHELGHIILHQNVSAADLKENRFHRMIEKQANNFASALLFPRAAFHREVKDVSLDYLCALKPKWGISIGAMIFRAFNRKMIDEREMTNLLKNLQRRGWRGVLAEPYDDTMEIEKPRLLRRALQILLEEGIIPIQSIRSLAAMPLSEIEALTGMRDGLLRDQELRSKEPVIHLNDLESDNVAPFAFNS